MLFQRECDGNVFTFRTFRLCLIVLRLKFWKFLEGLEATGFAAAHLGDARTCSQQPNTENVQSFLRKCWIKRLETVKGKKVRCWEALDLICVPPRLYDWEFCLETPIARRRSEPKAGVMFFSGVGFSDEAVNCQFVHHEKTCVFFLLEVWVFQKVATLDLDCFKVVNRRRRVC